MLKNQRIEINGGFVYFTFSRVVALNGFADLKKCNNMVMATGKINLSGTLVRHSSTPTFGETCVKFAASTTTNANTVSTTTVPATTVSATTVSATTSYTFIMKFTQNSTFNEEFNNRSSPAFIQLQNFYFENVIYTFKFCPFIYIVTKFEFD